MVFFSFKSKTVTYVSTLYYNVLENGFFYEACKDQLLNLIDFFCLGVGK